MAGCLPTRIGKIKTINTGELKRGDSIIFIGPAYTYDPFGSPISGSIWDKHTSRQKAFEEIWDSAQIESININFDKISQRINRDFETYSIRRFNFKVGLLGKYEKIKGDSISWLLSKFTWHTRDGKPDSAFKYLPDSIYNLSYTYPIVIITNNFFFFEKGFVSGYAEGSTGLRIVLSLICTVLKNGKIIYYRSYRKAFPYFKIIDDKEKLISINQKLFDKLKAH